ncbi:MAG: amino acid permease [Planctomycetota bacterium]
MTSDACTPPPESAPSLERSLSLWQLVVYGTGTILGLGIYVLLGKVAGAAGMLAPCAFLFAALIAGLTGLSYGELAARIPKSAGEVNYVDRAFGLSWLSAITGWLIVISALASTATVVNGYVGYVRVFVDLPDWLVISGITLLLGAVAVWGIKESVALIVGVTAIEVLGIVLVLVFGAPNLAHLGERWTELLPAASLADGQAIALGGFLAFFTFIGFEDLVNVAEEARHPERDMPRAIAISLVALTVIYVLVAVIAVLGLTPQELDRSEAPLADLLAKRGPSYPKIISAVSLVAILNGVLVQIVMIGRVLYGMGEQGLAPRLFSRVNARTRTPIWATVSATGVILALALCFDLEPLAHATTYVLLVVFCAVNLALWRIKRRDPDPHGVSTFPLAVPVLGFFLNLAVLGFQIYSSLWGSAPEAGA